MVWKRWNRQSVCVCIALALLAVALPACGPGGDNTAALPTEYRGRVVVPAAGGELAGGSLLARITKFVMPSAYALFGMESAGVGIPVILYAMDENGIQVGPVLAETLTEWSGDFTLTLPSWDTYPYNAPWVVEIGTEADNTRMRRFVDNRPPDLSVRSLSPASEAAVRVVLEDDVDTPFLKLSPEELAELTDLVEAASAASTGFDIAETTAVALQDARGNESLQRKLVTSTSTDENTRPLAHAGIDFRLNTGEGLNLVANAEDADGDPVSFQWRIVGLPDASALNPNPPVGRYLTFNPDTDGVYTLELVVTDSNLATSPPDYATIIATTAPVQLTVNTTTDAEGRMTGTRTLLVHTSSYRDPDTNTSYTDVYLQQMNDFGPLGSPQILLPPGVINPADVLDSYEIHPAISANGTMITFATDIDPGGGSSRSDFDIVALPVNDPTSALWLSDNLFHETQPDVQCVSGTRCVVVFVTGDDPDGSQIMATWLNNPGSGFVIESELQLTTGAGDHYSPRLSLDGQWVVFAARRDANPDLEIYRTRTDGAMFTPEQITFNAEDDDQPTVNATGSVIVYRRNGAIFLTTIGAGETLMTGSQVAARSPSISGNGNTLAFLGATDLGTDLFITTLGATFPTQLTAEGHVSQPWISVDGTRILFRSSIDGDHEFYLR